jgi:hypothetical protein
LSTHKFGDCDDFATNSFNATQSKNLEGNMTSAFCSTNGIAMFKNTTNPSNMTDYITVAKELATLFNGMLVSTEPQNGRGGSKGSGEAVILIRGNKFENCMMYKEYGLIICL